MSIGQRIRQVRQAANLTQEAVAKKVGISQPTLSALERGDAASSSEIVSIAMALGVSPTWLQTGKGDRMPLASDAKDLDAAAELLTLFAKLDSPRRADLLRFARTLSAPE